MSGIFISDVTWDNSILKALLNATEIMIMLIQCIFLWIKTYTNIKKKYECESFELVVGYIHDFGF